MELLLRKDLSFYAYFESQARVAVDSAREFFAMTQNLHDMRPHIDRLADLEHEGDEMTHALQKKVLETFITPLDKEDLRELSQALDDITDLIEAAAVRAELYRLTKSRPDLTPLVGTLVKSAELVAEAMSELRKGVHKTEKLEIKLTEIHTAENDSDRQYRQALADLFGEEEINPIDLIKWKEMYDRIEVAVDKCEDIAKIVGMILTKYG